MGGFGMGGFGAILWLVVLGAVIWAVIQTSNRTASAASRKDARTILDERLARGELSVEEYRKLRAEL